MSRFDTAWDIVAGAFWALMCVGTAFGYEPHTLTICVAFALTAMRSVDRLAKARRQRELLRLIAESKRPGRAS